MFRRKSFSLYSSGETLTFEFRATKISIFLGKFRDLNMFREMAESSDMKGGI